MIALTAAQIAEAVSGTLSATLDPATVLVHVTPDSREVTAEGTLYVAKPGERADGHDFIDMFRRRIAWSKAHTSQEEQ